MININGKEYSYDEADIINFVEGLIGLPNMRQAALIPLNDYEPFCWLASLDDEKNRFVVVNPCEIYMDYDPKVFDDDSSENSEKDNLNILTIVKISSDWKKTTVNLRSPIFFDSQTKKGVQIILSESDYKLAENLPNVE